MDEPAKLTVREKGPDVKGHTHCTIRFTREEQANPEAQGIDQGLLTELRGVRKEEGDC